MLYNFLLRYAKKITKIILFFGHYRFKKIIINKVFYLYC